jgi:hypothetical protein
MTTVAHGPPALPHTTGQTHHWSPPPKTDHGRTPLLPTNATRAPPTPHSTGWRIAALATRTATALPTIYLKPHERVAATSQRLSNDQQHARLAHRPLDSHASARTARHTTNHAAPTAPLHSPPAWQPASPPSARPALTASGRTNQNSRKTLAIGAPAACQHHHASECRQCQTLTAGNAAQAQDPGPRRCQSNAAKASFHQHDAKPLTLQPTTQRTRVDRASHSAMQSDPNLAAHAAAPLPTPTQQASHGRPSPPYSSRPGLGMPACLSPRHATCSPLTSLLRRPR